MKSNFGNNCLLPLIILRAGEMRRHYTQAETLLSICYCWRSKFIIKIDMKIYFRYLLNFVLLDSAFGVQQMHNVSVCLIFPALCNKQHIHTHTHTHTRTHTHTHTDQTLRKRWHWKGLVSMKISDTPPPFFLNNLPLF